MKSVVHKLIIIILIGLVHFQCFSQTIIQMEEYGGIYRIPCKVNGAKMKLIFDTGADKVCLSLSMADYLYDNGYITNEDIIGSGSSTVADGSIVDHIKIIIKDIEIEGIHLRNVEAVVIDGQNAPLLLGQSAIKKLGRYAIDGNKLVIYSNSSISHGQSNLRVSKTYVDQLFSEADSAYLNGYYNVAIEKYNELYNCGLLPPLGIYKFADCYSHVNEYESALKLCKSIEKDIESGNKNIVCELIGDCYKKLGRKELALEYYEKAKFHSEPYSKSHEYYTVLISWTYDQMGDFYKAFKNLKDYVSQFLYCKGLKAADCWSADTIKINDNDKEIIGDLYYQCYFTWYNAENCNDCEKYIILAAAWGKKEAIEECKKHNISYKNKPSKYIY